ncbi:hypothetical protein T440DRAFT_206848 [Plenodomus tracheiphilus IPT5]|uniref:Uncharacterized protein n=1 Tax=Plenodomus tracheiphilus IPT5 TaxID=1408161 RepID=A0A6A7BIH7_9PLEO|nr:hypothetical protein T440DRAFT_206848 [Plenodomus tracheiphilus IPT5]
MGVWFRVKVRQHLQQVRHGLPMSSICAALRMARATVAWAWCATAPWMQRHAGNDGLGEVEANGRVCTCDRCCDACTWAPSLLRRVRYVVGVSVSPRPTSPARAHGSFDSPASPRVGMPIPVRRPRRAQGLTSEAARTEQRASHGRIAWTSCLSPVASSHPQHMLDAALAHGHTVTTDPASKHPEQACVPPISRLLDPDTRRCRVFISPLYHHRHFHSSVTANRFPPGLLVHLGAALRHFPHPLGRISPGIATSSPQQRSSGSLSPSYWVL